MRGLHHLLCNQEYNRFLQEKAQEKRGGKTPHTHKACTSHNIVCIIPNKSLPHKIFNTDLSCLSLNLKFNLGDGQCIFALKPLAYLENNVNDLTKQLERSLTLQLVSLHVRSHRSVQGETKFSGKPSVRDQDKKG